MSRTPLRTSLCLPWSIAACYLNQPVHGNYKHLFLRGTKSDGCGTHQFNTSMHLVVRPVIIIKIKIHSSCEIEYFVETHICKLCVIHDQDEKACAGGRGAGGGGGKTPVTTALVKKVAEGEKKLLRVELESKSAD